MLNRAVLNRATLDGVVFKRAMLNGAALNEAALKGATLDEVAFQKAKLQLKNIIAKINTHFTNPNILLYYIILFH